MATTMARGKSNERKSKSKKKSKNVNKAEGFQDLKDLMTEEDKELFQGINDTDEERVKDVDGAEGNDIEQSEIASFIKEIGILKYQPPQAADDLDLIDEPSEKSPKELKQMESQDNDDSQENEESSTNKKKKKSKKDKQAEKLKAAGLKQTADPMLNGNATSELPTVSNETSNEVKKGKEINPKALDSALSYLKSHKSRKFLLIKPGDAWRDEEVRPVIKEPVDAKLVKEAETLASRLLTDEISLYKKQRESMKRSEARWLKTVLSTGTLTDKMAALTLLVQESPLHNASSIDMLINMASKKGRREALMAVDTLKDLFLTGLLPDDRKLKAFNHTHLMDLFTICSGNTDKRDKLLLYWHFENLLKKKYAQFIKILGELSFDTLQATKEKAMSTVYNLLSSKPEQEQVLLPMLVNKLGDQNIKSKASHWLTKLVEDHPNMKGVIVREIRQLLYRPNVSQRAQYYAICYLTQLRLHMEESELATQLIQIYFSFFQMFLKKGELDSKMLSALLTGVNRAFVFASEQKEEILNSMDEVYKIIPSVNFQTSVQALMLLFHVTDNSSNVSDRFYTTLYRKLADPSVRSSSKQAIFLNLLFKSLRRDTMNKRVMAFIKRILQVYSQHPPHIICGVLIVLSQIIREKPGLLNITKKAQIAWEADGVDDEEENFVDLPIPKEFLEPGHKSDEDIAEKDDEEFKISDSTLAKTTWVHRSNKGGRDAGNSYDPHHRNPLYSKAELDCVWELEELVKHFHPTVSLYANMMLKGDLIEYDGDPLLDFTLIRFLDRFVYKNPKKINNMTNVGAPQRRSTLKDHPVPVNSREFIQQEAGSIPEDEKFFYNYFLERSKRKKDKDEESDDGSISDGEFDTYLDKYGDALNDDLGEIDMDFAGDKTRSKDKKKGKDIESDSDDDDDEDDDDDDLDLDDDELAAEFEKELEGLEDEDDDEDGHSMPNGYGEDDEEEFDFEPDENDPLSMMMTVPKSASAKRKRMSLEDISEPPQMKKKKKSFDSSDLFASAEEFSHLLEEDVEGGKVSTGGSNQLQNKDKSAKKQMMWEEKRDNWLNEKSQRSRKKFNKGKGKRPGGKPGGAGFRIKQKAKFQKRRK